MSIVDHNVSNDKSFHLTWSLLLFFLFLTLGFSVKYTHFFDALNQGVLVFMMAHRSYFTDIFFIGSTLLCEAPFYYALISGILIWFILYRHWLVIILFSILLTFTFFLSPFFKHLFAIARPSADIVNIGYAFPSGHIFLACVAFGFISLVLTQHLKGSQKYAALFAYNIPALLVGVSRLYLGVHWLTDVMGGFLIAWAVNLLVFSVYIHHSTCNTKPNRLLFLLMAISLLIFFYLVSLHIEEQLYLYRYIANHLMTWQ